MNRRNEWRIMRSFCFPEGAGDTLAVNTPMEVNVISTLTAVWSILP
ncbi:hypothetical protein [Endozoicomonas sp. SESOKO3]|nr:hypothetical protein [Endozoicomonas sp. SESOKO3]